MFLFLLSPENKFSSTHSTTILSKEQTNKQKPQQLQSKKRRCLCLKLATPSSLPPTPKNTLGYLKLILLLAKEIFAVAVQGEDWKIII